MAGIWGRPNSSTKMPSCNQKKKRSMKWSSVKKMAAVWIFVAAGYPGRLGAGQAFGNGRHRRRLVQVGVVFVHQELVSEGVQLCRTHKRGSWPIRTSDRWQRDLLFSCEESILKCVGGGLIAWHTANVFKSQHGQKYFKIKRIEYLTK